MATQAGTNTTRFHDLDALRGFAMLLGILLHAGVFLVPVEYWPVHEAWAWETAPEANVYAWILSVIHGFRMPLFFLLSGFFTAMLWAVARAAAPVAASSETPRAPAGGGHVHRRPRHRLAGGRRRLRAARLAAGVGGRAAPSLVPVVPAVVCGHVHRRRQAGAGRSAILRGGCWCR